MDENSKEIKQKKTPNVIFVLSVILLIVGLAGVGWYFITQHKGQEQVEELKEKMIVHKDNSTTPDDEGLRYYMIHGKIVQERFKDIFLENEDFIGWIMSEDTPIDYPVMYTPEDDQYYLRKDFYGNYNIGGTIFMDARCDYIRPSENMILYGHSMNDGSKFQSIKKYDNDEYYKKHKYIHFDTLMGDATYEVIAAYKTEAHFADYEGYNVYNEINLGQDEYNEVIKNGKSLTPFETSDATYGEDLITLSTCSYHTNNGRFVVIAKKVKENKVDLTKDPIETIE